MMIATPPPRQSLAALTLTLTLALLAAPALADPPEIVAAEARASAGGWEFAVTLRHPDTGWEHYADGWAVHAPDGRLLGLRELVHPHETEQPFTRSLAGVAVPEDLAEVEIRARCNIDGWAAAGFRLALPR